MDRQPTRKKQPPLLNSDRPHSDEEDFDPHALDWPPSDDRDPFFDPDPPPVPEPDDFYHL